MQPTAANDARHPAISRRDTAVPLIIDALTLAAALFFLPRLTAVFQTISAVNAAILGAVFTGVCFSVYWLKKLEPAASPLSLPAALQRLVTTRAQQIAGVLFGVIFSLLLSRQLGYLDILLEVDDRVLGAGESSAFFVYAPGAWLGVSLIYVLILSSTAPPRFLHREARSGRLALLGLLGINAALLLFAADLTAALSGLPVAARWPALLAALALLFLPARLVYQAKQTQPAGVVSFSLLLVTLSLFAFFN